MSQSRPLFVYFRSFRVTISIQIEKSIYGVLGIQTRGHRMVGADKTTELWRPPTIFTFLLCRLSFLDFRLLDLPLKSVYNIYPSAKYCLPTEEKLLLQKCKWIVPKSGTYYLKMVIFYGMLNRKSRKYCAAIFPGKWLIVVQFIKCFLLKSFTQSEY